MPGLESEAIEEAAPAPRTPPTPEAPSNPAAMEGLAAGLHDGLTIHDLQPPTLAHDQAPTGPEHAHTSAHGSSHDHRHRHTPVHTHPHDVHGLDTAHAHADAVHALSHAHTSTHITAAAHSHSALSSPLHQTGVTSAIRGPPPLHPLTPTPATTVLPPTPTDKKPPTTGELHGARKHSR